jgi:hypothetical protein
VKQQTQENGNNIFSARLLSEIIVFVALAGALALISHSFFGWLYGEDQKSVYLQALFLGLLTLQLSLLLLTLLNLFLTIHWRLLV